MIIQIFEQKFITNNNNLIKYFNKTIFNLIKEYDDELEVKLTYLKINLYDKCISKFYNNIRNIIYRKTNIINHIQFKCPHNKLYEECNDDIHRVYYDYYCKLCNKPIDKKEKQKDYSINIIRKSINIVETEIVKRRKLI